MRTTLDIDDDLLSAAKELARRENTSAGRIVSRLLRDSMTRGAARPEPKHPAGKCVGGFRPLPGGERIVTNDQVNALRDEEGI